MTPTADDISRAEEQIRYSMGKITKLIFGEELLDLTWESFKNTPIGSMLITERAKYIALEREYHELLHPVRQLLIHFNRKLCLWCLTEVKTAADAERHALECEKSPANRERKLLEKKVVELTEMLREKQDGAQHNGENARASQKNGL